MYQMKKNIYFISLLIIISGFTFNGCPDPQPQITDCDPGYLPCENDQSECCEVVCDEGFHICGEDSTECCLDTASHEIFWNVDTIGNYGSYFSDVSIIEENNFWVVGKIYTDSGSFNAMHFNENQTKMVKVTYGQDLYGVRAFGDDDVWVTSGIPHHWNGEEWVTYHLWDMGVLSDEDGILKRIWGESSQSLFFIGNSGTIVYFDGSSFVKMDSFTTADLVNISGAIDQTTGIQKVWVCGIFTLLFFNGDSWSIVWDEENPLFEDNFNNPNSVYVVDESSVIVSVWGGDNSGLYKLDQNDQRDNWELLFNHDIFATGIAGSGINELLISGTLHKIIHYNGNSPYRYTEFEKTGFLSGIAFKNGRYIIVGSFDPENKGIIYTGDKF